MKSKILITGATGLIGLNLLKYLKASGEYEIHINYVNKLDPNFKKIIDKNIKKHQFDICDVKSISKLPKYDLIIHASGYGQPKKFTSDPYKTLYLNSISTHELLKKVKTKGTFVFLSSGEVYSESKNHQKSEFDKIIINPTNKRNCYILGKLFGEYISEFYCNQYKINFKNIRIGHTYGPGFKITDNKVINEFIIKSLTTNTIPLLDDGSATRNFLYVGDCVKMIWNIITKGQYHTYNVTGNTIITIKELAKKICEKTNAKLVVGERNNSVVSSPKSVNISSDLYDSEFGKYNYTSLDVGLDECINWGNMLLQNN